MLHLFWCKILAVPQLSPGAVDTTPEPAWARGVLMHRFYPAETLALPPQGFPSGSDSWASAGLTRALIAFLLLVAARRGAEGCAGGSPGLLTHSRLGMFCLSSLGKAISAGHPPPLLPSSFINLPVKHTAEGSFKNHERLWCSHLFLRLIKGVHRDTHTHKTHTTHTPAK